MAEGTHYKEVLENVNLLRKDQDDQRQMLNNLVQQVATLNHEYAVLAQEQGE